MNLAFAITAQDFHIHTDPHARNMASIFVTKIMKGLFLTFVHYCGFTLKAQTKDYTCYTIATDTTEKGRMNT